MRKCFWQTNLCFINMSSKTRTKSVTSVELNDSVWNLKTIAWLALILACLTLLLVVVWRQRQSQITSLPAAFEGKIVDKTVAAIETEQGSYPYYRLTVEIEGQQQRLNVPVTIEIYEQAQVGMRLRRSQKGLEVINHAPR
jgi:hypothetical protein